MTRSPAKAAPADPAAAASPQERPHRPLDAAAVRRVGRAIGELRRGTPLVLTGNGAAALVLATETAETETLDLLVDTAKDFPGLTVTAARARALGLDLPGDARAMRLALAATDPATAVRQALALADPSRIEAGEPPHVEQAVAAAPLDLQALVLAKQAQLLPAALVAEIPEAAVADLERTHGLIAVTAEEVEAFRAQAAADVRQIAEARVPLAAAEDARVHAFRPRDGGPEHFAIVIGTPNPGSPVLTRLHSECFTGDLLGSLRCDCGEQLRGAIEAIAEAGSGVLLYLAQEGRGIGLVNKLRAYRLQDAGADTLEANTTLGFDADERIYLPAAEILRQLGFQQVRLLTNNPDKVAALAACGIEVTERVPHHFPSNDHNELYLSTKARRFGHLY